VRPPPRRARAIRSMLSRWLQPTTCKRPVSPGALTRTHTGLSQPRRARTHGSSGTPPNATARAYRLARSMIRSPPPRRSVSWQRALIRTVRYSSPSTSTAISAVIDLSDWWKGNRGGIVGRVGRGRRSFRVCCRCVFALWLREPM
jgi:hypothetical protein